MMTSRVMKIDNAKDVALQYNHRNILTNSGESMLSILALFTSALDDADIIRSCVG